VPPWPPEQPAQSGLAGAVLKVLAALPLAVAALAPVLLAFVPVLLIAVVLFLPALLPLFVVCLGILAGEDASPSVECLPRNDGQFQI
jgi:hypothetical protein